MKLEHLDLKLITRESFECLMSYNLTLKFAEVVNGLIDKANEGYLFFYNDVPEPIEFSIELEGGRFDSLCNSCAILVGHTRDKKGRIYVTRADLVNYFGKLKWVHKDAFKTIDLETL